LIQQQKQDSDRPRTLKSIKRYKNSKHSTEPIGVFYSQPLHKTLTTVPRSSSSQSERQQTLNLNLQNSSRKHDSEDDLTQKSQTKKSVSYSENISKHHISPCNPSNTSNDHLSLLTKRYGEMRRCQSKLFEKGQLIFFVWFKKKLNPNKIMTIYIYIVICHSYHLY
jgi:hypothetical protein